MGLFEQNIKQIQVLINKKLSGKISNEDAMVELALYTNQQKSGSEILRAMIAGARYGKRLENQILNKNLIDKHSALDLSGEEKEELLMCPKNRAAIPLSSCLDHSGRAENFDSCERECEHFEKPRRTLLPVVVPAKDKNDNTGKGNGEIQP